MSVHTPKEKRGKEEETRRGAEGDRVKMRRWVWTRGQRGQVEGEWGKYIDH